MDRLFFWMNVENIFWADEYISNTPSFYVGSLHVWKPTLHFRHNVIFISDVTAQKSAKLCRNTLGANRTFLQTTITYVRNSFIVKLHVWWSKVYVGSIFN